MPNIEIHGFESSITQGAQQILETIKGIFRGQVIFSEIATEIVFSSARDLAGNRLPYLRVWDTEEGRAQDITNTLRMNGFRVERPVALEEYVEPPMWTEEEIRQDLLNWEKFAREMERIALLEEVLQAKEWLRRHLYEEVADFYILKARELNQVFDFARGLHQRDFDIKMGLGEYDDQVYDGVTRVNTRLVMLVQIIRSLEPSWKLSDIFPDDDEKE